MLLSGCDAKNEPPQMLRKQHLNNEKFDFFSSRDFSHKVRGEEARYIPETKSTVEIADNIPPTKMGLCCISIIALAKVKESAEENGGMWEAGIKKKKKP